MSAVAKDTVTVCGVLVAVEFLSHLCEETELLRFVRGVGVLLLLASFLLSISQLDFNLTLPQTETAAHGEELTSLVEAEVDSTAKEQYTAYLEGLLGSAGLHAEKITLSTSKTEDGSIVLDKAEFTFAYEVDRERAAALLRSVIPQDVEVMTYAAH